MRARRVAVWAFAAALFLPGGAARAQGPDFDSVTIEAEKVAEGIYALQGRGGNIGVSVGEDGAFLVDDQYAPLTPKIQAAVAELGAGPIRFVLNTHWHGDHTGGNENLGEAGALIVAHDNVRERMSAEQFNRLFDRTTPPSPEGALPVVTFSDRVTFHLNGEEIHAFHVDPAHTDGDSIVRFRRSDVVHMGDVFFNGTFPFVDTSSGGAVDGMIAAVEQVLEATGQTTRFIPGHGPVCGRAELEAYRDMLKAVRAEVAALIEAGASEDEVVAAGPTAAYDAEWGGGFMSPEVFTRIVYQSLSAAE